MAILVTGASGFIGSALVARLLAQGRSVVAQDRAFADRAVTPNLELIAGDIADRRVRARALEAGVEAIVHLATVPGGAAEADPAASKRINIDAMHDLVVEAAAAAVSPPRFVFASSIAVLGDPLPSGGVDDATPLAPRLVYGGHKAMMEVEIAMMSRRGEIDAVTIRLSGILARPQGAAGMKSAFMSDVFHSLKAKLPLQIPVSPSATLWVLSVERCVDNLVYALELDSTHLPESRAVTLPAVRTTMIDLIAEICRQTDAHPRLISFNPDPAIERAFGSHPPLTTSAAQAAGFRADADTAALVRSALAQIAREEVQRL